MTTYCMLGSLILGLLAWFLPVGAMVWKAKNRKIWLIFSLMACALSLGLQVVYFWHLTRTGDFSAMEDTFRAVAFAVSVMVSVTLVLNGVSLRIWKWRKEG